MIKKILILSAIGSFILFAVIGHVYYQATKIPGNNASKALMLLGFANVVMVLLAFLLPKR